MPLSTPNLMVHSSLSAATNPDSKTKSTFKLPSPIPAQSRSWYKDLQDQFVVLISMASKIKYLRVFTPYSGTKGGISNTSVKF